MLVVTDGANQFAVSTQIICADPELPFYLEIWNFQQQPKIVTLNVSLSGQFYLYSFQKQPADDLTNGVVALLEATQYNARLYQNSDVTLYTFRIKTDGNPNAIPE